MPETELSEVCEEIRRREKVIRIFPNMDSAWRLIGAVLAEKHEDGNLGFPRSTSRKYLDMAKYRKWKKQASGIESEPDESTERQPVMAT